MLTKIFILSLSVPSSDCLATVTLSEHNRTCYPWNVKTTLTPRADAPVHHFQKSTEFSQLTRICGSPVLSTRNVRRIGSERNAGTSLNVPFLRYRPGWTQRKPIVIPYTGTSRQSTVCGGMVGLANSRTLCLTVKRRPTPLFEHSARSTETVRVVRDSRRSCMM